MFAPLVYLYGLGAVVLSEIFILGVPMHELHHRWSQWDSIHYEAVAQSGYIDRVGAGWLPGYPMLVAFTRVMTHDTQMAGVAVTVASGLVAAWLLGRLVAEKRFTPLEQRAAVATVLTWPFAFFLYGAVYPMATYLAIALGAFLAVERRRTAAPVLLAAAACLVRPEALVLALSIVVAICLRDGIVTVHDGGGSGRWRRQRIRFDRSALQARHGWLVVSVAGLALLAAHAWATFGSPFAYAQAQAEVSRGGPPLSLKNLLSLDYVSTMLGQEREVSSAVVQTIGLLLLLAVIALTPAVARRLGGGYAVLSAATAVFVYVSLPDFVSTPRYLATVFPVLIIIGLWIARRARPLRVILLACSGSIMVVLHLLYSQSIGFPAW